MQNLIRQSTEIMLVYAGSTPLLESATLTELISLNILFPTCELVIMVPLLLLLSFAVRSWGHALPTDVCVCAHTYKDSIKV